MKADKEYIDARKYFVDKYNNGYMTDDEKYIFDDIIRINTYETSIKEVEKTIKRLRDLQRHKKKIVIKAYKKEMGL